MTDDAAERREGPKALGPLAEATPESISELMSRDPEGFSKQDLEKVVATLRAQRERFLAAEGVARPRGAARKTETTRTAEDLGL